MLQVLSSLFSVMCNHHRMAEFHASSRKLKPQTSEGTPQVTHPPKVQMAKHGSRICGIKCLFACGLLAISVYKQWVIWCD